MRKETEGETDLSRVKKRARKIKEGTLMRPLRKKKKPESNFLRKLPLHPRNRLARKTREFSKTKVKITADDVVITKEFLNIRVTGFHEK